MTNAKIMVVEDESIIAEDIRNRLQDMGYSVPAIASSGKKAIQKAEETHPDLVLMDIVLKGGMDGVEAARQIRARFDIPVVYVTAYGDDATLQRAKSTGPGGYILKPYKETELHASIEIALYNHKLIQGLKDTRPVIDTKDIDGAIIATDNKGLVTFMNPIAEILTGCMQKDALGREIFKVVSKENLTFAEHPAVKALQEALFLPACNQYTTDWEFAEIPAAKALREQVGVDQGDHMLLVARDGAERPIGYSVIPSRDHKSKIAGVVFVLRDIKESNRVEEIFKKAKEATELYNRARLEFKENGDNRISKPAAASTSPIGELRDDIILKINSTEHDCFENIFASGERVIELLATLSSLADAQFGEEVLEVSKFPLRAILTSSLDGFREEADKHNVNLSLEIKPEADTEIEADYESLKRIMASLLNNAMKFTPDGGFIRLGAQRVSGLYAQESDSSPEQADVDFFEISVEDSGIGINPEDFPRLMKFTQLDTRQIKECSGKWAELTLARRLIELHGGKFWVESKFGKGNRFGFLIPIATGKA